MENFHFPEAYWVILKMTLLCASILLVVFTEMTCERIKSSVGEFGGYFLCNGAICGANSESQ